MKMAGEMKVFIAGSRRLSKLDKDVKQRIDNIIDKGLTVIIGDANGVDKAVQRYLNGRHYRNVVVFCMEGGCRNNVGKWHTRIIAASHPERKDFAYFSTKDRAMVEDADYGLMLWDGESRGTLTSIIDLVRRGKPVVLYISADKTFYTLRESADLATLSEHVGSTALHRIGQELQFSHIGLPPGRREDNISLF
jgi:uncharacterized phage-like protein YoqJ